MAAALMGTRRSSRGQHPSVQSIRSPDAQQGVKSRSCLVGGRTRRSPAWTGCMRCTSKPSETRCARSPPPRGNPSQERAGLGLMLRNLRSELSVKRTRLLFYTLIPRFSSFIPLPLVDARLVRSSLFPHPGLVDLFYLRFCLSRYFL